MKREKNFFYFLVMIMFIICYVASLVTACRIVEIGKLTPTASFIIYPMTYFLGILFAERYGKTEAKMMFNYAAFALLIMSLFITISSTLPVLNGHDGLEILFNMNYRLVFASLSSFYASQFLNLEIYHYISGFRGFKFLISGVIAATIDSFIFVILAFAGSVPMATLIERFTSQYVVNVFMIIVYTILFTYLIDTVVKTKKKNSEQEKVVETPQKKQVVKVSKPISKPRKKTTTAKATKKETK